MVGVIQIPDTVEVGELGYTVCYLLVLGFDALTLVDVFCVDQCLVHVAKMGVKKYDCCHFLRWCHEQVLLVKTKCDLFFI